MNKPADRRIEDSKKILDEDIYQMLLSGNDRRTGLADRRVIERRVKQADCYNQIFMGSHKVNNEPMKGYLVNVDRREGERRG